jgi:integrase/recombinase XerD
MEIGEDVKEAVDSFLNHLVVEKGFSQNTLEAYKNDLYQFISYVNNGRPPGETSQTGDLPSESNGTVGWKQVDLDILTSYVSGLRGKKSYRDTTTARKVAALKSFFNFLIQEETIDEDPTEFLNGPRVGRNLPKFLSEEEVERLLDQAAKEESPEGRRDWAMLELLYATGLRVSELVSLNVQDVNLQDGYVRCIGKGSKERITYMYARAVRVLETYIEEARPRLLSPAGAASPKADSNRNGAETQNERGGKAGATEKALFINHRGDRLTRQWVWSVLKTYAKKASLDVPITPHILRHSFATHMLQGGASLRHVQELLGHSSITTTQVYTHLTTEHVRREFDKSHPRA